MPGHFGRGTGRTGSAGVRAVSVLLAGTLSTAVGVAALRSDTASADTRLERGPDAVLRLADGTSRPALEGELVPRGATVTAGRTGAVLTTREREVHLGADAVVTVVDGARQVVRSGYVLADASDAPGVELRTDAATVTTDDDSLVRVDDGPLLRVGVLRGDAADVRPAGRRAATEVATYYQVQVPQGGLPGAPSPFVLTPGDRYERELASELVRADEDLTALAARLDTDGGAGGAVRAALRSDVPDDPTLAPGAPSSESALGYLIASATGEDVASAYGQVRALRSAGGSWGVVAAIVDADVARVAAALSALLSPGSVPVVAGGALDLDGVLEVPGAPAAPVAGEDDDGSTEQPRPRPRPTSGGPGPTAPPTTPPGPADPVTEVVDEVVDTVMDLVDPSPSAGPVVLDVPLQVPLLAPTPLATVQVQVPLLR